MKERNKFFMDQLYWGEWDRAGCPRWGAELFKATFSGRVGANLPMNNKPILKTIINEDGARVMIRLLPCNPRGVRKHRVTTYCDKCGKWVFTGRVHQHRC